MNLLEMMKREVSNLCLKDELEIAYYIYLRTGQLFLYNVSFIFIEEEEQNKLKEQFLDIGKVTNWEIICYTWADAYIKLVSAFGIEARKIDVKNRHAYVEITINNQKFEADLTANYEDITLIKAGFKPCHFFPLTNDTKKENPVDKVEKSFLEKGIRSSKTANKIKKTKQMLEVLKKVIKNKVGNESYKEEFIYVIFKKIEELVNDPDKNFGEVSGSKYIAFLLNQFLEKKDIPKDTVFYDSEKQTCIKAFELKRGDGAPAYYVYHKLPDGLCKLQEVPYVYIECLCASGLIRYSNNLAIKSMKETLYDTTMNMLNTTKSSNKLHYYR